MKRTILILLWGREAPLGSLAEGNCVLVLKHQSRSQILNITDPCSMLHRTKACPVYCGDHG